MRAEKIHERASLFGEAVFAADDGLITTFAVVAGSAGATLSPAVVLILGFANLFADGLSMATGKYLGVKTELEYEKAEDKNVVDHASPLKNAIVTYLAFIVIGFVPLIPFVFGLKDAFVWSTILVAISLLLIGGFRSFFTKKGWIQSALEMLLIGGGSAGLAYLIGYLIENLII